MEQYHELLKGVLGEGDVTYEPRTQTHTIGISAWQSKYDLRKGFPQVTTKNVPPRLPFEEYFWKARGERNVKSLVDRNVPIWTANAFDRYLKTNGLSEKFPKHTLEWNTEFDRYSKRIAEDAKFAETAGDLGPVYGYQWRHWKKPVFVPGHPGNPDWIDEHWKIEEVDQLANVINGIKENPGSRYHVLSAWNVSDLKDMALGPCPFWHQFSVFGDYLDLTMVQRSNDTYLGSPFNISQDALQLEMIARETGKIPRFFNHQTINTHLYLGIAPRTDFWENAENVTEFQSRFNQIRGREEYLKLKEWYLNNVPEESQDNERKDHVPFVLEQLSKEPKKLPGVTLEDIPFMEAIQLPGGDVVKVEGYHPHKWDSKAKMAA